MYYASAESFAALLRLRSALGAGAKPLYLGVHDGAPALIAPYSGGLVAALLEGPAPTHGVAWSQRLGIREAEYAPRITLEVATDRVGVSITAGPWHEAAPATVLRRVPTLPFFWNAERAVTLWWPYVRTILPSDCVSLVSSAYTLTLYTRGGLLRLKRKRSAHMCPAPAKFDAGVLDALDQRPFFEMAPALPQEDGRPQFVAFRDPGLFGVVILAKTRPSEPRPVVKRRNVTTHLARREDDEITWGVHISNTSIVAVPIPPNVKRCAQLVSVVGGNWVTWSNGEPRPFVSAESGACRLLRFVSEVPPTQEYRGAQRRKCARTAGWNGRAGGR